MCLHVVIGRVYWNSQPKQFLSNFYFLIDTIICLYCVKLKIRLESFQYQFSIRSVVKRLKNDESQLSTGGRVALDRNVLQHLRRKKGFSQELVALLCAEQHLCVSIASIKRAELGRNILYRTARNIAQFFEVELDSLIASNNVPAVAFPDQRIKISIASKRDIVVVVCELIHPDDNLFSDIEEGWCTACQSAAKFAGKYFQLNHTQMAFLFGGEALMGYEHLQAMQLVTRLQQHMFIHYRDEAAIHSFICYQQVLPADTALFYPELKAVIAMAEASPIRKIPEKLGKTDLILVTEPIKQELEARFCLNAFDLVDTQQAIWRVNEGKTGSSEVKGFIGRELQCRQFEAAVESVFAYNEMQVIYINGMAGIGKTRLQEVFCDYAENLGIACHRTHVLDFGVEHSQRAIPKLIRSILQLSADETNLSYQELNDRFGGEVCEQQDLLFLYSWLDWTLSGKARTIFHTMSHEVRTAGMNKVVAGLIQSCTQQSPILLCIEDMHWAQDDLLENIQLFAEALKDSPVLLLLTSRKENDPLQKKWATAWVDLPMLVISLAPLRQVEAAQFADYFAVNDEYKQQCINRAEGNPLFLEQLLREQPTSFDSLPHTLQTLVSARLESLPVACQNAARAASVLGQWFTAAALNFVLDVKDFDIQPLIEHYLVRSVGERFQFVHALVQQGIYQAITDDARVKLHQRCAHWFENVDVALQARHLNRARAETTFSVYLQAINGEIEAHNFDEASVLVNEAFAIDYIAIDENRLWCRKGEIMDAQGMTSQAVEYYRNAINKARSDCQKFAPLMGLANGLDTLEHHNAALAALVAAEACLSAENKNRQLSQIHYLRGNFYFPKGQVDTCFEEHNKALQYARLAKDKLAEAKALGGLGDAAYAQGKMVTAFNYFRQCLALCSTPTFGKVKAANLFMLATARIYLNETESAVSDALASAELASAVGHKRAEIVSRLTAAWVFLSMQMLEPARQQIEQGLQLVDAVGAHRFKPFLFESQARYHYACGDRATALSVIKQAWADVEAQGIEEFIGPWVISSYALIATDEAKAQDLLATGTALLNKGCIGHNTFRYYANAMESCLERHDWSALKGYVDDFKTFTKDEPTPWSVFQINRAELIAEAQQGSSLNGSSSNLIERLQTLKSQGVAASFNHSLVGIEHALSKLHQGVAASQ